MDDETRDELDRLADEMDWDGMPASVLARHYAGLEIDGEPRLVVRLRASTEAG